MNSSFSGIRVRELASASSGDHHITIAYYLFPDGTEHPYLEVSESHPWYKGSRLVALSEAVHVLLNLGEMEIYQISTRDEDYKGLSTGKSI